MMNLKVLDFSSHCSVWGSPFTRHQSIHVRWLCASRAADARRRNRLVATCIALFLEVEVLGGEETQNAAAAGEGNRAGLKKSKSGGFLH
mmetsp:Transcript_15624/g.38712  ORF Transcript_15624/g.38712 Transcript_15624/m.38712 type:complete len:89 (-) Transcript_15624:101-367(-)